MANLVVIIVPSDFFWFCTCSAKHGIVFSYHLIIKSESKLFMSLLLQLTVGSSLTIFSGYRYHDQSHKFFCHTSSNRDSLDKNFSPIFELALCPSFCDTWEFRSHWGNLL